MERVSGHIDRISDNAIIGWIANHDHTASLEPFIIYCHDNDARMLFRPHWYRPDVCDELGISGIFGIAVPLDLLPSEWTAISITTRAGTLLGNGKQTLPERKAGGFRDGSSNIFLHIQKTAGTSLRHVIETSGTAAERCFLHSGLPGITLQQFHSLPLYQRRRFDIIAGHLLFGIHRFLGKPCRYFAFLREPMARLQSNYRHHRTAQAASPELWPFELPLETLVNEGLWDEFDNLQVRILAGVGPELVPLGAISNSELELAISNVENHFGFVGIVENIDNDAAIFFKKLNLPLQPLTHMNISDKSDDYSLDRIDWDRVRHRHRYDAQLYDLIRSHKVRPGGSFKLSDRDLL